MALFGGGNPKAPVRALKWEGIPKADAWGPASTYRTKIPGGWIFLCDSNGGVTFIPDPEHTWDGSSL